MDLVSTKPRIVRQLQAVRRGPSRREYAARQALLAMVRRRGSSFDDIDVPAQVRCVSQPDGTIATIATCALHPIIEGDLSRMSEELA
jgi:hypothetical protein